MTREEHIYQLKQYLQGKSISMCPASSLYWQEHWEEVIKALEQEPTTKNDLGVDCIDRNSIKYYPGTGGYMYASKGEIDKLPSVTPQEPRIGHWIVEKGGSYLGKRNGCCSNCKDFYTNDWNVMSFCPNCGADMSEVEE